MPLSTPPRARLTVQQSFPDPRPTTNPYLVMLADSLRETGEVEVRTFTWRRALWGRFDLFHVHWPEILVSGTSPAKALVRQALTVLLLLRLRLTRTPLVRTVHNLELPSGLTRVQRAILAMGERQTALRIRLNELTPLPDPTASATILHGHYREWYGAHPRHEAVPGRLAYVGLVRRYKNALALVRAFRDLDDPAATLTVGGRPSSADLAEELVAAAGDDPRISLTLRFLEDAELVAAVTAAELVVLPYREMHNSGGVLAALSLDRPVLVPANPVAEHLSREAGRGWVVQYDGELTAPVLQSALEEVRSRASLRPDLHRREWAAVGREHLAVYRRALVRTGRM